MEWASLSESIFPDGMALECSLEKTRNTRRWLGTCYAIGAGAGNRTLTYSLGS